MRAWQDARERAHGPVLLDLAVELRAEATRLHEDAKRFETRGYALLAVDLRKIAGRLDRLAGWLRTGKHE